MSRAMEITDEMEDELDSKLTEIIPKDYKDVVYFWQDKNKLVLIQSKTEGYVFARGFFIFKGDKYIPVAIIVIREKQANELLKRFMELVCLKQE